MLSEYETPHKKLCNISEVLNKSVCTLYIKCICFSYVHMLAAVTAMSKSNVNLMCSEHKYVIAVKHIIHLYFTTKYIYIERVRKLLKYLPHKALSYPLVSNSLSSLLQPMSHVLMHHEET